MTRRSIVTRTATIALAAAALASPTALARPAETPPSVAKAATVEQHKQARRSANANGFPTGPVIDRPSYSSDSRPDAVPTAPADRGNTWATIGIALAAGLLAIVAIAGIARPGRARTTA
jgi:hypothetical protein